MKNMTINSAGGKAFALSDKQALAQLACTGTIRGTYLTSSNLTNTFVTYLSKVDPEFIARLAIYSRKSALMKDTPALLLAHLASIRSDLFEKVFPQVVDNTKMLKNTVSMIRSGQFGRKSLGTRPKRVIQNWLNSKSDDYLFRGSIGAKPSLGDVIRLVHPKPLTDSRKALYGYLTDAMTDSEKEVFLQNQKNEKKTPHSYNPEALPALVQSFEEFKKNPNGVTLPNLSFEMLSSLELNQSHWAAIAANATWTQIRMNLNTFLRHGVFNQEGMVELIANRLSDSEEIKKAKVFPYQLFTAYQNLDAGMPMPIMSALQGAMEVATRNVPTLEGTIVICPDVSGSMQWKLTDTSTSVTRCVDVAALIACCLIRNNPDAIVLPFENKLVNVQLDPNKPVMENAAMLAKVGGGGTNCSLPLVKINQEQINPDVVIFLSDNASWLDNGYQTTGTKTEWQRIQQRYPTAKMICVDVKPNLNSQIETSPNVLNIGGWSDQAFLVMENFVKFGMDPDYWVNTIENIDI